MADRVQLKDPQNGSIYSVDADQVAAAQRHQGLVPASPEDVASFQKQERSGGLGDQLRTVPEAALATGAKTVEVLQQALQKATGFGTAPGLVDEAGSQTTAESIAPSAFTAGAIERREANPTAALAGTALAEAPLMAIPGVGEAGWAARLGIAAARGAASGAIAEAGQSVLTGEEFSAKHAAFYGLVGESLGALASGGIGRLMRETGKEAPSALELAARRASKADVADALGETSTSSFKATKMADNAEALTEKAATELGEHLSSINQKLDRAEAAAFSTASIRRNVSKNTVAQGENLLSRGVELEDTARKLVTDAVSPEHSAFAQQIQESVDELLSKRSSADMYTTLRKVTSELYENAPENLPDYAHAALSRLDDSLVDEGVWGGISKLASGAKSGQVARGAFRSTVFPDDQLNRQAISGLFEDGADRTAFTTYLDSAESAAKGSGDKGLRKAVESAREALDSGDNAVTSKLLRDTFAEKASNYVTGKVVRGVLRYGLGAVGLHGGIAGGVAGAALGDAVAPSVSKFVEPAVRTAVDAVSPLIEASASRFSADGVAPVLRRLSQSAATQIETAGRSLSNSALAASQSTIGALGAPTMSTGIARFMGSHDNLRSAFAEKREVLDLIQRDPTALVDEMNDSLGGLSATHPELHDAIAAKHFQAISFLRTKIPETVGVSMASPTGIPASQLAIRQFALYYSGATDPSSVVEDVRNNRVRQEQLEALKAVWPEVYVDLKAATLQGMSHSRPTVQQRMRMDLLFDFGSALDAGLSWSLALVMDSAQAQGVQRSSAPKGRSTPSTIAQQPQGLAALANPQTTQV